jgi:endonuclease/exonuclease/phosphatase family metal-dependent hydrolase
LAWILRVLTWNLMHGRSVPGAGHDLLDEFSSALASWEWDVALLQETPPWWPPALGRKLDAEFRGVLTSRNALLPLRRAVATRWPDVIKSNGGGANAILARRDRIVEHRIHRLRLMPERRWVHGVRLARGWWVANLHATVHNGAAAIEEVHAAAAAALNWAAGEPLALGGDFNVRQLSLASLLYGGGHDVDHVFAAGFANDGPAEVLDAGRLSDHAPVLVTLTPEGSG